MKKFKLTLLKLGNAEVLTKEEMKNVKGGVMASPCGSGQNLYRCGVSNDCGSVGGVTCGVDSMDAVNRNIAYWQAIGCGDSSVACNGIAIS